MNSFTKGVFALLAVIFDIAFGFYLLEFIRVSSFIWLLWILSILFTFLHALANIMED